MDTQAMREGAEPVGAYEAAARRMQAAVWAHVRGEGTAPLYLVTSPEYGVGAATLLDAAAAELRAAGRGGQPLTGTGDEFKRLWRDTLRRGTTPFVRRALAARQAILLDGVEALRGEPFAQGELARVMTPDRFVALAGHGHPQHVAAWSPPLAARLDAATTLCLHDGPCFADADARAIVDLVADYYGLTRALLLSKRRMGPVVRARQMAMALLREQGLTYDAVGLVLNRDHSTVIYGHARIRRLSAREPGVRDDLVRLRHRAHAA